MLTDDSTLSRHRRERVASVGVFRAVFIPPLPGAPRYDLAALVRTARADQLDTAAMGLAQPDAEPKLWYLIAAGHGQPRTYRVSAIVGLRPLPERFTRPDGFDLATFWHAHVERYEPRRLADSGCPCGVPVELTRSCYRNGSPP